MSPFDFPDEPPDNDAATHAAQVERDRRALEAVRQSLVDAGFYAYGTLDDQNRWTIAVDDEEGRADVRIGPDGYEVELRATSPGLYADEESEWRRQSRSRLARISIPNIARGFLEPHQHATWDEVEQGVSVSETYQLPFTRAADIGQFVRTNLPTLELVLARIEAQLG